MKKLTGLVFILFLSSAAFGDDIKFVNNLSWEQVKEKAAREKKMIFFDAYTTWCGPCKYLEKSVYTNAAVADYFNANYINVKFDMETAEGLKLAEEFEVNSYPTLLFFSPDGKLVHKYIGAMEAAEFIDLGQEAKDPSKQYFVLKEKARLLLLSDADFNKWAASAEKLEDGDKDAIMAAYLRSKTDILGNKDMASTVLRYAANLTDKQLSYLHSSKQKIAQLMEWDAARTSSVLYKKLFRQAAAAYERNYNLDSFRALIRKFDPGKENYAVKDLQFKVAVFIDKDMGKAADLLIQYMGDKKQPVDIETIASWLLDYSSSFEAAHFAKINTRLASFQVRPIDKDKEYWLYLMQMLCYAQAGDEAKARSFAEKAYHHKNLPEEYRDILKTSYGLTE
ncbi:MAG: thioredoxin domain-containing protein [Chitinophagaceae bacterium]